MDASDGDTKGASNNELLLAAARTDNEELLLEVLEQDGTFDINCQDGKYPVINGSTDVLEYILSQEGCDVDPINRIDGATPLHLAVLLDHPGLRKHVVESLLDAGADTLIKDKNGFIVLDLIPSDDTEMRTLIRRSQAQSSISKDDIASDDEGEAGSSSGSGSEDE